MKTAACERYSAVLTLLGAAGRAFAQTNAGAAGGLPKLAPPYGPLPPTFWELHGKIVIGAIIAVAVVAILAIWLRYRRKPPVLVPPDVQARAALEALRDKAEDGILLSKVTQIIRAYIIAAFGLPPREFTTAEFCNILAADGRIGGELAASLSDFLRQCDERKFARPRPEASVNAVDQALGLVATAEARRLQQRQSVGSPNH